MSPLICLALLRWLTIVPQQQYASEVGDKLTKLGLYVDVDNSAETLNKKIRNGELAQYNFILGMPPILRNNHAYILMLMSMIQLWVKKSSTVSPSMSATATMSAPRLKAKRLRLRRWHRRWLRSRQTVASRTNSRLFLVVEFALLVFLYHNCCVERIKGIDACSLACLCHTRRPPKRHTQHTHRMNRRNESAPQTPGAATPNCFRCAAGSQSR